jgi:hypothetical protein
MQSSKLSKIKAYRRDIKTILSTWLKCSWLISATKGTYQKSLVSSSLILVSAVAKQRDAYTVTSLTATQLRGITWDILNMYSTNSYLHGFFDPYEKGASFKCASVGMAALRLQNLTLSEISLSFSIFLRWQRRNATSCCCKGDPDLVKRSVRYADVKSKARICIRFTYGELCHSLDIALFFTLPFRINFHKCL